MSGARLRCLDAAAWISAQRSGERFPSSYLRRMSMPLSNWPSSPRPDRAPFGNAEMKLIEGQARPPPIAVRQLGPTRACRRPCPSQG